MSVLNNFVVFEGCDGSGTTTQLKLLEEHFKKNAASLPPFKATFEPTDGEVGVFIRRVLSGGIELQPQTLARLFAADRNEHLFGKNGIADAVKSGFFVVSDRYILSSLVYQGLECGGELPHSLNRDFPVPELLIFFDLDNQSALQRMENRAVKDIYEKLDFQVLVRERYKVLLDTCRNEGSAVHIVDSSKSIEAVAAEVWSIIKKMPIFKSVV